MTESCAQNPAGSTKRAGSAQVKRASVGDVLHPPRHPRSALALHNSSTGAESDLINEFITETRGNHASKAEEEKKDSPWNKSLFYYITGWARRGEDDEDEQEKE